VNQEHERSPRADCDLLRRVVELIGAVSDVSWLATQVAQLLRGAFHADAAFVYVLDDDDRHLTLAGATAPFEDAVGSVQLALGTGVSGWVASHRQAVILPEGKANDLRWLPFPQLRGSEFTSMASVPMLTSAGDVVGVVNLHTTRRRDYDEQEITLLHSTATLVAGTVHTARLVRRLELQRVQQRLLSTRLIAAEEQERARLAGELHDGVAQRLAATSFHLSAAREWLADDPQAAAVELTRAAALLELAGQETRSAVQALRPPLLDDLGLEAGLRALARDVPGVDIDVDVDIAGLAMSLEQQTALYRIAQEALNNVVKHAQAGKVTLRLLCQATTVVLEVIDDGVGLLPDGPQQTYGLRGMADRARLLDAQLDVIGRPGSGTTVRVAVPLGPG
jgi:two-component system NarL family sensor kinase